MNIEINKKNFLPALIYNQPIDYKGIKLYPITMKDIIAFQIFSPSIIVRKNSTFRDKKIIKMTYFDFLLYSYENKNLEKEYNIDGLSQYYIYAIQLLTLCCKNSEIKINQYNGQIIIDEKPITPKEFDDLRRIIIIQNDIDFDIDEFLNYDTEQSLIKAQKTMDRNKKNADIEDYIDSLIIAMHITEDRVMNMTIRKFWRYIKRYNLHEKYTIMKTGECSGLITFKEPIEHWMISLYEDDKYKNLKTDENELRGKLG